MTNRHLITRPLAVPADIQRVDAVAVNKPSTLYDALSVRNGNVVTTAGGTVSVAFANNPTGATLGGTRSVTASQGVATFTDLTISKIGSGYTLRVSSSGLTPATSNLINVTKNGNVLSTLVPAAGTAVASLSLAPLVLDSPDLWDGVQNKKRGAILRRA